MMESILKTINHVNSSNYLFDKFLAASAWSSLSYLKISADSIACLMTSPLCDALPFFEGSSFQVLLTKHLNSTCTTYTFLFQNLSSHCLLGIGLLNLARTCKEYINTILGSFPSQPNHYIMMVSICTDEYFIRPSAKLCMVRPCVHAMSNRASAKIIVGQYLVYPSPSYLSLPHLCSPHMLLVVMDQVFYAKG